MKDGDEPSRQSSAALRDFGRFSGYGIAWALAALLLAWGGVELDERLGTGPLLVILGAVLGIVAGFITLYMRAVVEPAARKGDTPGPREDHP
ncbi:MAG: AtpZ/AtpI family protein [Gemmatimonadota bacterium]|nr:AtpZ/AtpI family protein [Gemmatimonadota bacterium]